MIRPQPARWFEILAARDDAMLVLEALAATGAIELEARATAVLPAMLGDLRPLLSQFAQFRLRYRAHWPPPARRSTAYPGPPVAILAQCLDRIRAWAIDAEPPIAQLQRGAAEREELLRWRRVLEALGSSAIDLADAAAAGPLVQSRLLVLSQDGEPAPPRGVLVRRFDVDGVVHALAVGAAAELQALVQQVVALKGRAFALPAWLDTDREVSESRIAARLDELEREQARLEAHLAALHERHDLAGALGDAGRLQWMIDNVRALESGELFCWITGWTSEPAGDGLAAALEHSGARALLHFPRPPPEAKAPLILANPRWARPFELFSRALGMPSRNEADPTALLAVVVPLLFGYMFGDVGQGLVIAAAGLLIRKRWPPARLFVACGIAACAFGVLFGSVFGLHGIVPPLWIDPLADPLTVLLVPLYGGAVLLTVGVLLSALEAHWRGELRGWLCSEVWLAVVYVALLAAVTHRAWLGAAAFAAAMFCAGRAMAARRAVAGAVALAELLERTLQILINTLSFARVGAFALAHAGLSSAIVALMGAAGGGIAGAVVLLIGNVVVLVLEGLVVTIQTTRLVLFEFFTRFLVAQGRVFRPLPAPPFTVQEH
jgi:V/A-type H+-transporting ATPase subunit I